MTKAILNTLNDQIKLAVTAAGWAVSQISFTNVPFNTPNDGYYVETVWIPNNPADRYYDERQLQQGIFRVVLHWPDDGSGPYDAMEKLEEIISHFRKDVRYNGIQIYETPKILDPLAGAGDLLYPATIRYRIF